MCVLTHSSCVSKRIRKARPARKDELAGHPQPCPKATVSCLAAASPATRWRGRLLSTIPICLPAQQTDRVQHCNLEPHGSGQQAKGKRSRIPEQTLPPRGFNQGFISTSPVDIKKANPPVPCQPLERLISPAVSAAISNCGPHWARPPVPASALSARVHCRDETPGTVQNRCPDWTAS
jgi:hypothetical protein